MEELGLLGAKLLPSEGGHPEAAGASAARLRSVPVSSPAPAPKSGKKGKAAERTEDPEALAALELQKKNGSQSAPSELHAMQPTISKRFKAVHDKQLAKVRLGEKALIGTYASPSAKNIHDSLEYLPFILPPAGLLLLGIVTFGVVTIRKQQKIPSMPTQGRLDIKDVQASARAMQSKV